MSILNPFKRKPNQLVNDIAGKVAESFGRSQAVQPTQYMRDRLTMQQPANSRGMAVAKSYAQKRLGLDNQPVTKPQTAPFNPQPTEQYKTPAGPPMPTPTPTPKVPEPTPSIGDSFTQRQDAIAQQRMIDAQNRRLEQAQQMQAMRDPLYAQREKSLLEQRKRIPEQLKTATEAINMGKQGAITSAENTMGEDLRASAQTKRELDSQRQNTFANLGTIDSGGYYGMQGQQFNADTALLRDQAKIRENAQLQKNKIENDAQTAINTATQTFQASIDKINNTIYENDSQRQIDAQKALNDLENALAGIEDNYVKTMADVDKTVTGWENDLRKQKMTTEGGIGNDKLSEEFIISGYKKPTTIYDQMFLNNAQMKKPASQSLAESGLDAAKQLDAVLATGNVDRFKTRIVGNGAAYIDPMIDNMMFRAVDALLRARSGAAVKDEEIRAYMRSTLPNAADNIDSAKSKMENFKYDLNTYIPSYMQNTNNTGKEIRVIDIASGQTGTIPEDEFDPSLYKRIQ